MSQRGRGSSEQLWRIMGRRLRQLREERGLSQEALAAKVRELGRADFTQYLITRIETGRRPIGVEEWVLLAFVLRVPAWAFIDPAQRIALSPGLIVGQGAIQQVFNTGRILESLGKDSGKPGGVYWSEAEAAQKVVFETLPADPVPRIRLIPALAPGVLPLKLYTHSRGLLEQHIGRRLHEEGITGRADPVVAAAAGFGLFGVSPTAERERRGGERRENVRVVSREIVEEILERVAEVIAEIRGEK